MVLLETLSRICKRDAVSVFEKLDGNNQDLHLVIFYEFTSEIGIQAVYLVG